MGEYWQERQVLASNLWYKWKEKWIRKVRNPQASSMSKKEKRILVRRKRSPQNKAGRGGKKLVSELERSPLG